MSSSARSEGSVAVRAAVAALLGAVSVGAVQVTAHATLLRAQAGDRWAAVARAWCSPSVLSSVAAVLFVGYVSQAVVTFVIGTRVLSSRAAFGRSIFEQIARGELLTPIAPPPDADVIELHEEVDRMRGALWSVSAQLSAADDRLRALFSYIASELAEPLSMLETSTEVERDRLEAREITAIHAAATRIEILLGEVRRRARSDALTRDEPPSPGARASARALRGWPSRVRLGTKLASIAFAYMLIEASAQATALAMILPPSATDELARRSALDGFGPHVAIAVGFYAFDALCVALWINATVRPRVGALTGVARRIADGELSAELPPVVEAEFVALHAALGDMQASLRAAIESHRRARDSRRELFADLAHELATPLASIYALADALEAEHRERLVFLLRREVARLVRLVKDINDVAKLDGPTLSLGKEPVDVAELVRSVVSSAEIASAGSLIVDVTAPEFAIAVVDRQRIEQVLANLLLNVRRHAARADVARCWVTLTVDEARVCVDVDDDGPGVDDRFVQQVGQRMWRADPSRQQTTGGHGLGLAIVRKIIEKHGGELSFERSTRGGLRVSFQVARK